MTSESARLDPPKIEFACTCGKRYRVSPDKAGSRIRCKKCKLKVTVPQREVSGRSRAAILAGLGIDPATAQDAYDRERARQEARKQLAEAERQAEKLGYRCSKCDALIESGEVPESYSGEEGLLCSECKKKKEKRPAVALISTETPEQTLRATIGYLALFAAGFTGFLDAFTSLSLAASIAIALPAAALGAYIVYRARRADPPAAPAEPSPKPKFDEGGMPIL
jgi:DNA-directed RNA polymerase subunit RPC12/RpoP